ncbi:MAG: hypothetical protein QMD36_06675 [Candidatus Aenigmarchaeota archaeon]|nr:hypothetical protein [Candidatus Aenigmarchaeota archaeon]
MAEEWIEKITKRLYLEFDEVEKLSKISKQVAEMYFERKKISRKAPSTIALGSVYLANLLLNYKLTQKELIKATGNIRSIHALIDGFQDIIRSLNPDSETSFHWYYPRDYKPVLEYLKKCITDLEI